MASETTAYNTTVSDLDLDSWGFELAGIKSKLLSDLDLNKAYDSIPRTELVAADTIADKLGKRLSYSAGNNTWYLWDGHIHLPCESDAIAILFIRLYYRATADAIALVKEKIELTAKQMEVSGLTDAKKKADEIRASYNKGEITKHKAFREKLSTDGGQKAVLSQLKTVLGVPADYFENEERNWFVTDNCVIDVRATTEQRKVVTVEHDPARPVWRAFKGAYQPGVVNEHLNKFLANSFADITQAEYFGKVVGTAMIGAPSKMKTIVDVYGETDGGKSMINTVIERLAPDFYYEATENAIVKGAKDADRHRDEMRHARIISFLEVKGKLDKTFVLKYTGGDTITTDRKYRNSLQWRSQGVILMMSNEGMNIGSQEEAIADRIERVNFPHRFTFDSEDPRYRKDPELGDNIVANPSGVLNWMLDSYIAHLNDNVDGKPKASESMAFLKAELQDSDNTVAIFWDKAINKKYQWDRDAVPSKMVPFVQFYADYKSWCRDTNMPQMEQADVKAWGKREGKINRISSQLRLDHYVATGNVYVNLT
jgi:phage/plasmid-associated DNA primase